MPRLFLAIDGGGTRCRARLADDGGRVLAEGAGGPSNLTLGLDVARAAVMEAAATAFAAAGLDAAAMAKTSAAMGMAGANASRLGGPFEQFGWPFAAVTVASDAEIACLGAHGGADGGILILGTGSQGVIIAGGASRAVGGWGFMLSDGGSGAVLGHRAARRALLGHEGLAPASGFTRAAMTRFHDDPEKMLAFALAARPADWASLVPLVFEHAAAGDGVALALVAEAAVEVDGLVARMAALGAGRIALMGGLAEPYVRYLHEATRAVLVAPAGDALAGALVLARGETGFRAAKRRD